MKILNDREQCVAPKTISIIILIIIITIINQKMIKIM